MGIPHWNPKIFGTWTSDINRPCQTHGDVGSAASRDGRPGAADVRWIRTGEAKVVVILLGNPYRIWDIVWYCWDIIGYYWDIIGYYWISPLDLWTQCELMDFPRPFFATLCTTFYPLLKGDRVWSRFICCSSRGHPNGWKSLWLDVVFNLLYVLAMTMPTAATMIKMSRCWIHTYESLVGGLELFLFVHSVGNNHPNWITHIFQRGRLKPPTIYNHYYWILFGIITRS